MKAVFKCEERSRGEVDTITLDNDGYDNPNFVDLTMTTHDEEGNIKGEIELSVYIDDIYQAAKLFKSIQEDRS